MLAGDRQIPTLGDEIAPIDEGLAILWERKLMGNFRPD